MLSIKICTLYYILLNIVVNIHTLVPLSTVDDCDIAATERYTRNTVNYLFTSFKIQNIKNTSKIKLLSTIHDYFASITIKDCQSLKEIEKLSRVIVTDNVIRNFIAQINDVLNTDDKTNEDIDKNTYLSSHIQHFVNKLKILKNIVSERDPHSENFIEENYYKNEANEATQEGEINNDYDFWQPSGRRIYKGISTGIKRFPFMASILILNKFQCAGSIIQSDLVITSASCLQLAWNNRFFRENPNFVSVSVGCDYFQYCGDHINVMEVYFHPQYDPRILKHNLAVLRLSRHINFRSSTRKVKKIAIDDKSSPLPINTNHVKIVGWGAKDVHNIVYDVVRNKLSYADLDIYPLQDCQEIYSKDFVTNHHFCAGYMSKGGGACNQDVGGPGITGNMLIGVISFGSPNCGALDSPTVFTKLGFYLDWIEEIMELKVKTPDGRTTTKAPPIPFVLYKEPTKTTFTMSVIGSNRKSTTTAGDTRGLRMPKDLNFVDFLETVLSPEEVVAYLNENEAEAIDTLREDEHLTDNKVQNKLADIRDDITANDTNNDMNSLETNELSNERSKESTLALRNAVTLLTYYDKVDREEVDMDSLTLAQIETPQSTKLLQESKKANVVSLNDVTTKSYDDEIKLYTPLIRELAMAKVMSLKNISRNEEHYLVPSTTSKSFENSTRQGKVGTESNVFDDIYQEKGLSIETEHFNDSSLKDQPEPIKNQDVISEATMFDLISLAIEEQAKLLENNKRNIL